MRYFGRRVLIRTAEAYRRECYRQAKLYREERRLEAHSDLWRGRAEAMTAFIHWLGGFA